MPTVNLTQATYEKLQKLADETGCSPDQAVDLAVSRELRDRQLTSREWEQEWDALVTKIRSRIPASITAEEIDAEIAAAVAEARALRRARSR